ncbi:hypothetical protein PV328_000408 [Microctonus aethiopoides]|uniref:Uncharacterized protein n=1 Tax=Microctonus aethiopoides TaxID=144406 RepID=A0AA39FVJ3_9HYME|nr:hypothetical protein PV328_000408 [Microctonus aethiopoides]
MAVEALAHMVVNSRTWFFVLQGNQKCVVVIQIRIDVKKEEKKISDRSSDLERYVGANLDLCSHWHVVQNSMAESRTLEATSIQQTEDEGVEISQQFFVAI